MYLAVLCVILEPVCFCLAMALLCCVSHSLFCVSNCHGLAVLCVSDHVKRTDQINGCNVRARRIHTAGGLRVHRGPFSSHDPGFHMWVGCDYVNHTVVA